MNSATICVEENDSGDRLPRNKILVLNRNWQAVNIVGVKRAFALLFQDHARVINTHNGEFIPMDAEEWFAHSDSHANAPEEAFINTVRLRILIPKVLLLRSFDRLPVTEIKFNRDNVFLRDNFTCQYTGKRCKVTELTLDHVIPRDRGGRTSWENIVTCRRDINSMKANRLPHEAGLSLLRKPGRPKVRPFAAQVVASGMDQDWRFFLPVERSAG
jgi:5-methylcytosine-specific restriction endonuclease McrA